MSRKLRVGAVIATFVMVAVVLTTWGSAVFRNIVATEPTTRYGPPHWETAIMVGLVGGLVASVIVAAALALVARRG
jgi:hypothetical protein